MEIYVVTSGIYSEYGIRAVFTDKHKAEMYCAIQNRTEDEDEYDYTYRVETHEIIDHHVQCEIDMQYLFTVFETSQEPPKRYDYIYRMHPKNENRIQKEHRWDGDHIIAKVFLTKNDPDLAFKIGKDMLAKYKAEQEGL